MKKIVFLTSAFFVFGLLIHRISAQSDGFTDVPDTHPYKSGIDFVKSQKIVSGYPDGTFQPDKILNRAEFTKIVVASRFPDVAIGGCVAAERYYKTPVFTDVEHKVWFEEFVCQAKKEGIIGGYADGSFKPTNTIIFAEAAKIVVKSYGLKGNFTGDPWFAPFIKKLQELQSVPDSLQKISDDGKRATKQMTRGEMADIIYRLRSVQDIVKDSEGNFSLRVPEVALEESVKRESIKISKLPDSERPIQEVNGAPMLFYKLEPPGTKFSQAITFDIQIPTVGKTIPMIFFVSGDEVEMIPTPIIEIDPQTELAYLSAKIEHFSEVGIAGTSPVEFDMQEGPSIGLEDEPFTVGFTIRWDKGKSEGFAYEGKGVKIRYGDHWTLFGMNSMYTNALIASKEISEESIEEGIDQEEVDIEFDRDASDPDAIIISDIKEFFHNETFECATAKHNQRVKFVFNIGWSYIMVRGDTEIPVKRVSTIALRSAPFRCVSEEENSDFLGDLRCAGVQPVSLEDRSIPLQVIKPDEDVNCYLSSDLEILLPVESGCDEDNLAPAFEGTFVESVSLDRTPRTVIDPDPEGCHLGSVDLMSEGFLFLGPAQMQSRIEKLNEKPAAEKIPFPSFEGTVSIAPVDDEDLQHPLRACSDSDPFDLDGAGAEVTIKGKTIKMLFSEKESIPQLSGQFAPNGLIYADAVSLTQADAFFIGKMSLVDELMSISGTLQLFSSECETNTVITIEEE